MRTRNFLRAGIGFATGLAFAIAAGIAPASAAPPSSQPVQLVASSASCANFEGLTLAQQSPTFSGVMLYAGESITAKVSPVTTGDILLDTSVGFNFAFTSAPVSTGLKFTAPTSRLYDLRYSLTNVAVVPALTWTFDCSTTTVSAGGGGTVVAPSDQDRDGVADSADRCPATTLPDSISRPAAGKYFANGSRLFVDGTGRSSGITVSDTGGCSATQIAKATGLSKNAAKSGIALTTLQSWAATH